MILVWNVTVTKNTTSTTKEKTILEVPVGVVHQFELYFPPGCAGLVHTHINDALHQIWPYNSDSNFSGDDINISFQEDHEISEPPYSLDFWAWNEDDTYNHTVTLRLGILPREVIYPWTVGGVTGWLRKLMGGF